MNNPPLSDQYGNPIKSEASPKASTDWIVVHDENNKFVCAYPKEAMERWAENVSRQLYYGPPLPKQEEAYWCEIIVDGQQVRAMHHPKSDTMHKVDGYEETAEVYPKGSYTFDHYLTLMEF